MRFVPEVAPQLEAVFRGEQAPAGEDVVHKLRADFQICGEPGLRKSVIVEEIAEHGGGGIGERNFVFHDGSMVIGDFYFDSIASFPAEDDAPLLVDADGMKAVQVSPECFKAVSWRIAKVFKGLGFMDGDKLVIGALLDFAGKSAG